MKKFLLLFLLLGSLWAQVPVPTASMYERDAPELKALVQWPPIAGATQYNVYEARSSGIDPNSCPAFDAVLSNGAPAWALDTTVTDNYYLDDPNPSWWKIPLSGRWKGRAWCYAISSIVNGVESAWSTPQFVAIGNTGYLTIKYQTFCAGGPVVNPFPYALSQFDTHIYYTDPTGIRTEISTISEINLRTAAAEWVWKLPTLAASGVLIPWVENPGPYTYTYTLKTPDGGRYGGRIVPQYEGDMAYYNQVTIIRVPSGPDCPAQPLNYNFWENVTR